MCVYLPAGPRGWAGLGWAGSKKQEGAARLPRCDADVRCEMRCRARKQLPKLALG